ncbi:MAG: LytTR family DNA-binding domain-containing protein [Bacteroidota bacterium]
MKQVLICEDEKLIANRLKRFVEESLCQPAKLHMVHTLSDALGWMAQHKIDLLFLDLNLHGRDGFEVLKRLVHGSFHTIIVSAHTDKAITAFDYGVLDFVGKPFTLERIQRAVNRFEDLEESAPQPIKYLAVRTKDRVDFIEVKDVLFIKAAGIYAELVLQNGDIKIYDKPLNQLLKLLPSTFQRVHKSYVVPIERIAHIENRTVNTYALILKSGHQIPLSRSKRKVLLKQLEASF